MNTIHDRLDQIIRYKGVTKKQLEQELGVSNGAIGKVIRNKSSFGVDILINLLQVYPDLNPEWLLTGEGEMLRSPNEAPGDSYKDKYLALLEKTNELYEENRTLRDKVGEQ